MSKTSHYLFATRQGLRLGDEAKAKNLCVYLFPAHGLTGHGLTLTLVIVCDQGPSATTKCSLEFGRPGRGLADGVERTFFPQRVSLRRASTRKSQLCRDRSIHTPTYALFDKQVHIITYRYLQVAPSLSNCSLSWSGGCLAP